MIDFLIIVISGTIGIICFCTAIKLWCGDDQAYEENRQKLLRGEKLTENDIRRIFIKGYIR